MDSETVKYRELIQGRPAPTLDQMHRFAYYLSDAHSWYKHLPATGAGEPFFVFLDPQARRFPVQRAEGHWAFREVVEDLERARPRAWFRQLRVVLEPGDTPPQDRSDIARVTKGKTTAEALELYGHWSYWNFGPPDQPRHEALEAAAAGLRVHDDDGAELPVPRAALELGLVYLRATVSPGFAIDDDRMAKAGLTRDDAELDRRRQLTALVDAMVAVTTWVIEA
jgi:hypothetical protein